jgi:hypothetical protein
MSFGKVLITFIWFDIKISYLNVRVFCSAVKYKKLHFFMRQCTHFLSSVAQGGISSLDEKVDLSIKS